MTNFIKKKLFLEVSESYLNLFVILHNNYEVKELPGIYWLRTASSKH